MPRGFKSKNVTRVTKIINLTSRASLLSTTRRSRRLTRRSRPWTGSTSATGPSQSRESHLYMATVQGGHWQFNWLFNRLAHFKAFFELIVQQQAFKQFKNPFWGPFSDHFKILLKCHPSLSMWTYIHSIFQISRQLGSLTTMEQFLLFLGDPRFISITKWQ